MKKWHIFALVLAAVALSLVISTFKGASRYVNFAEAKQLSTSDALGAAVHLMGLLPKDKEGKVWGIEEAEDHRSCRFLLIDARGDTLEVRYPRPLPMDFIRAEQVVLVGRATDTYFEAEKILLKCPSKYEEEQAIYK